MGEGHLRLKEFEGGNCVFVTRKLWKFNHKLYKLGIRELKGMLEMGQVLKIRINIERIDPLKVGLSSKHLGYCGVSEAQLISPFLGNHCLG